MACALNDGENAKAHGTWVHKSKEIIIEDDERGLVAVHLDIYDTTGDEKYSTIPKPYYGGAHGAIIMYDLTNKDTFEDVSLWVHESQKCIKSDRSCVLYALGTKKDLVNTDPKGRKVSRKDLKEITMRKQHLTVLGEIDCKSKKHVGSVLEEVAHSLIDTIPHKIKTSAAFKAEVAAHEPASCGCILI